MSPLRSAIVAQIVSGLVVFVASASAVPAALDHPLLMAAAQGLLAAAIAAALRAPAWWLPIHLGFMPLVVVAGRLDIAPGWYLLAFLLTLAIFWRTDRSQVPLYLSNRRTAAAVATLLPAAPCWIIDLGSGDGSLLRQLAKVRPDCRFLGIEHAPLPWLWSRLTAARLANCEIRRGDFWRQPLDSFDVAYAFLSPAPMQALWLKACAEMKPLSLLISNSFPIPGVTPENTLKVADRRQTNLFCYRPGGQ
jgi:hypothetical protein